MSIILIGVGGQMHRSWGSLRSHADWENNALQNLITLWPWPSPLSADQKNLANSKIMKRKEGKFMEWPSSIPELPPSKDYREPEVSGDL